MDKLTATVSVSLELSKCSVTVKLGLKFVETGVLTT